MNDILPPPWCVLNGEISDCANAPLSGLSADWVTDVLLQVNLLISVGLGLVFVVAVAGGVVAGWFLAGGGRS
jgi:hypothetical protein